ncbi:MAG TPA: amidohydrolase, partial [Pseudonocardia sp.]|nr:amidohydrolase [Pseudonocardia sp.]
PATRTVVPDAAMVLPGLVDAHVHLGFAGRQVAWELPLSPMSGPTEILAEVRERAGRLGPDEWVVGGILGGAVFEAVGTPEGLAALDEASLGRPVMLRDNSLHNRWVNSRALELMGVTEGTPDPADGHFGRDGRGALVGLLYEGASTRAEAAAREHTRDARARDLRSVRTAVSILNSLGVTAAMDAATMGVWLDAFNELDNAGELTTWIVACLAAREFVDPGVAGPELFATAGRRRSAHVRPDFVKAVLDGVPMTRTALFLEPYVELGDGGGGGGGAGHGPAHACGFYGHSFYTDEELLEVLEQAVAHGLHAKLHATGDGTVRQVLDAVEKVRARHGAGPVIHVAHPEFVHPDDVARFAELEVVADVSPALWFPHLMNTIIGEQVGERYLARIWPLRELHEAGVPLAAGSDWPAATVRPDPWLSIESMVTRRNPDPAFPGTLAPDQAVDLPTALRAHTVNPARAIGLGEETGQLRAGLSADFIAIDQHLLDIPVDQIHRTQVRQTWFAGALVYES